MCRPSPAGILEPSFASYLRSFTEQSAPQPDPAAKLFLLRNFSGGQPADPAAAPPADGVELTNGLECKIATATSKVRLGIWSERQLHLSAAMG